MPHADALTPPSLPEGPFPAGPITAGTPGRVETLIVSDLHLGLRSSRPRDLLEILESWRFERLILLGDVFHEMSLRHLCHDSWRLLAHLSDLSRRRRVEVIWLHGNHDRSHGFVMQVLLGIKGMERFAWTSGGQRFLALHGDCFDDFISANARLARTLSSLYGACQRYLSSEGRWPMALDRLHGRLWKLGDRIAERAATHARASAADVVVCGHTHLPGIRHFGDDGQPLAYVNAGSWVSRPASFVTVDGPRFALMAVP